MSYSIDANLLLYASDESNPRCKPAKRFLRECASRPEPLCLCWPVLMAYLRIATHPRIFAAPLTPQTATDNLERLLALPQAYVLTEGKRFWECYRQITGEVPVRGNLVPDAHVAALLMERGIALLYTSDRDFRKFVSVTTCDFFS